MASINVEDKKAAVHKRVIKDALSLMEDRKHGP